MLCKKTIRKKIVEAARERFVHYGYCKTTMAEVAADCNMSTGNLYRYFPGKLDIAEEIGWDSVQETCDALRDVVRKAGPEPRAMLRAFLFETLERTFDRIAHHPKIFELADILRRERPEFGARRQAVERSILVEILSAGNTSGEFAIDDVVATATLIQALTLKYRFPQLHSQQPLAELRRELDAVISLVFCGLGSKIPAADRKSAIPVSVSLGAPY